MGIFKGWGKEYHEVQLGAGEDHSASTPENLMKQAMAVAGELGVNATTPQELRKMAQQVKEKDGPWPMRYDISRIDWAPESYQLFLGVGVDHEAQAAWVHQLDMARARPLLVTTDSPKEGRHFLQAAVASMIGLGQISEKIVCTVITPEPGAWKSLVQPGVRVIPVYETAANHELNTLAGWGHSSPDKQPRQVLVFDDISRASRLDYDTRQNLWWLLNKGPRNGVYTLASATQDMDAAMWRTCNWYFGERVLGASLAQQKGLEPGIEFLYFDQDRRDWPLFRIPSF